MNDTRCTKHGDMMLVVPLLLIDAAAGARSSFRCLRGFDNTALKYLSYFLTTLFDREYNARFTPYITVQRYIILPARVVSQSFSATIEVQRFSKNISYPQIRSLN